MEIDKEMTRGEEGWERHLMDCRDQRTETHLIKRRIWTRSFNQPSRAKPDPEPPLRHRRMTATALPRWPAQSTSLSLLVPVVSVVVGFWCFPSVASSF